MACASQSQTSSVWFVRRHPDGSAFDAVVAAPLVDSCQQHLAANMHTSTNQANSDSPADRRKSETSAKASMGHPSQPTPAQQEAPICQQLRTCFGKTPRSQTAADIPIAATAFGVTKSGSYHLADLSHRDGDAPAIRSNAPPTAPDDSLIEKRLFDRDAVEARHVANGVDTVKMDGFKLCRCHEAILHRRTSQVQRLFGINPTASIHNGDHFPGEGPTLVRLTAVNTSGPTPCRPEQAKLSTCAATKDSDHGHGFASQKRRLRHSSCRCPNSTRGVSWEEWTGRLL
jgi:hypothetical protein